MPGRMQHLLTSKVPNRYHLRDLRYNTLLVFLSIIFPPAGIIYYYFKKKYTQPWYEAEVQSEEE